MTLVAFKSAPARVATPDDFVVLWQDATTRRFMRVGTLSRRAGQYEFRYATPRPASFPGFTSFPEMDRQYRSSNLFPLFANRVMTSRRDGYVDYLNSLGLDGDASRPADPFEVLARTWGSRQTDRVVVIPLPRPAADGLLSCIIPVHGFRHVDPRGQRLSGLRAGNPLTLERELENPASARAILVEPMGHHGREQALGYVPDELTPMIHELWRQEAPMQVRVEHINRPGESPVADRFRVLVRLDAICDPGSDPASLVGR